MKQLIIICAGGFGRELAAWAPQCIGYNVDWNLKGFIDSDIQRIKNNVCSIPIIDTIDDYLPNENDLFICAIGDINLKQKFIKSISEKGGEFMNLIHQSSIISSQNVSFGKGCFIGPRCTISCDVVIGDHVSLNCHVDIGHDVIISSFVHANPFSFIGGYSKIGVCSVIHPHAIVLPSVKISDNCVVGAGSTVFKNVNHGATVYGSPAKEIF